MKTCQHAITQISLSSTNKHLWILDNLLVLRRKQVEASVHSWSVKGIHHFECLYSRLSCGEVVECYNHQFWEEGGSCAMHLENTTRLSRKLGSKATTVVRTDDLSGMKSQKVRTKFYSDCL